MEYRPLGTTGLNVSAICLGTMTWGQQNSEAQAQAQMDRAVAAGVNFFDTAEMYPVPTRAETQGLTERHIGTWLRARKSRDKILVATKVSGRSTNLKWLRDGAPRLDRANILAAVEASLQRLGTDYIDLYQLHWPDRQTNFFGELGYGHKSDDVFVPLEETLGVLADLQRQGKIRHVGVSNETPWGISTYLKLAETGGLPRAASIQNPYNLLNRTFEIGLAEIAIRERCGLLAYSPLGFGILSGKYVGGAKPAGARLTLFADRMTRYQKPRVAAAVAEYATLARDHGLEPSQMALAFALGRPFMTAVIIGATTLEQLETDLGSASVRLSPEILEAIERIHRDNPNPAP